jgi:hypothetical protein
MSAIEDLLIGLESFNADALRESIMRLLSEQPTDVILHPLGFYMAKLNRSGATDIRLHYWPADHRERGTAVTQYHDHVWALRSCILAGEIENVLLDVVPDDHGQFQLAQIHQRAGTDEVVPAPQPVSIRETARDTHRVNEFYEIEPRRFHFTDVAAGRAALTVVRATVQVEGGPRTLVPIGYAGQAPSRSPLKDPSLVLAEIKDLIRSPSVG